MGGWFINQLQRLLNFLCMSRKVWIKACFPTVPEVSQSTGKDRKSLIYPCIIPGFLLPLPLVLLTAEYLQMPNSCGILWHSSYFVHLTSILRSTLFSSAFLVFPFQNLLLYLQQSIMHPHFVKSYRVHSSGSLIHVLTASPQGKESTVSNTAVNMIICLKLQ